MYIHQQWAEWSSKIWNEYLLHYWLSTNYCLVLIDLILHYALSNKILPSEGLSDQNWRINYSQFVYFILMRAQTIARKLQVWPYYPEALLVTISSSGGSITQAKNIVDLLKVYSNRLKYLCLYIAYQL